MDSYAKRFGKNEINFMKKSDEIIKILKAHSSEESRKGMERYGIKSENAFGTGIPLLREIAKHHKKDHELALELWETGFHEARILASMVDDPNEVDEKQMERWVKDFDSWDVCDQCCMNLFKLTFFAWEKVVEWSRSEEEFVKRAAFALMACFAHGNKTTSDEDFFPFFKIIYEQTDDERNMVKKAVNWALRQIGKRNKTLNKIAIEWSEKISKKESKAAKWIAADALRELKSEAVQNRLK
jgi:3-methyladenine DNA glycosylase AlkD